MSYNEVNVGTKGHKDYYPKDEKLEAELKILSEDYDAYRLVGFDPDDLSTYKYCTFQPICSKFGCGVVVDVDTEEEKVILITDFGNKCTFSWEEFNTSCEITSKLTEGGFLRRVERQFTLFSENWGDYF